ncbi:winged helix-turn-helix domain-containing protein [Pleionea sediminis]|uniref:winged helix-turn-helix domain-containing protein n=1 Tax=Pleionea sediminis TaxID=2569479 RepID=UPI001184C274|nr:winged helix-turn-helix domain-containing protein [Pleionea sediminis]
MNIDELEKGFSCGEFDVFPARNILVHQESNVEVKVRPKIMQLLVVLASRQGETLSKDALLDTIWPDTVTSEVVLSRTVADLRKILNDPAQSSNYIETVTKKGYQLICEVQPFDSGKKKGLSFAHVAGLSIVCFVILVVVIFNVAKELKKPSASLPLLQKRNQITFDRDDQMRPRFNHDASKIVYIKKPSENGRQINRHVEVRLYDRKLSKDYKITEFKSDNIAVTFADEDSNQLLIRNTQDNQCYIFIYNIIQKTNTPISRCDLHAVLTIDWLPEKALILTSALDASKNTVPQIIDSKTKTAIQLDVDFKRKSHLYSRFSPSGRYIASVSTNLVRSDSISIIDTKTNDVSFIQTSKGINTQVMWGETDNDLYFQALNETGLWYLRLDTMTYKQMAYEFYRDIDLHSKTLDYVAAMQSLESYILVNRKSEKSAPVNTRQNINLDIQYRFIEGSSRGNNFLLTSRVDGNQGLWQYSDGELSKLLSNPDLTTIDAQYSKDGSYYFVLTLNHLNNTQVLKITDDHIEVFAELDSPTNAFKVSEDESKIFYVNTSGLMAYHKMNERSESILRQPRIKSFDINENYVIYTQNNGSALNVYLYDLESQTNKEIKLPQSLSTNAAAILLGPSHAHFVTSLKNDFRVYQYDLAGNALSEVYQQTFQKISQIDLLNHTPDLKLHIKTVSGSNLIIQASIK